MIEVAPAWKFGCRRVYARPIRDHLKEFDINYPNESDLQTRISQAYRMQESEALIEKIWNPDCCYWNISGFMWIWKPGYRDGSNRTLTGKGDQWRDSDL